MLRVLNLTRTTFSIRDIQIINILLLQVYDPVNVMHKNADMHRQNKFTLRMVHNKGMQEQVVVSHDNTLTIFHNTYCNIDERAQQFALSALTRGCQIL